MASDFWILMEGIEHNGAMLPDAVSVFPAAPPPLCAALEAARIAAGLSRAQLAARVGLTSAQIRAIEMGEGDPVIWTLTRIADALGYRLVLR